MAFAALDEATMMKVLEIHLPGLDPELYDYLIASAGGSVSTALAYADLDMATIDDALEKLAGTGDATNAIRSKLAQTLSLKSAIPRYEAFLGRTPTFIAAKARKAAGAQLQAALSAWTKACTLSQVAVLQSLPAETVVFEMAGLVASLATTERAAKA